MRIDQEFEVQPESEMDETYPNTEAGLRKLQADIEEMEREDARFYGEQLAFCDALIEALDKIGRRPTN